MKTMSKGLVYLQIDILASAVASVVLLSRSNS